jgi:molybdopterin synthase sulfur carrier subunit
MAVKLVFLGRLADLTGATEREVSAPLNWSALLDALQAELGGWLASDRVRLAVNGTVLADKMELQARDGDEVALLPPVSGG